MRLPQSALKLQRHFWFYRYIGTLFDLSIRVLFLYAEIIHKNSRSENRAAIWVKSLVIYFFRLVPTARKSWQASMTRSLLPS